MSCIYKTIIPIVLFLIIFQNAYSANNLRDLIKQSQTFISQGYIDEAIGCLNQVLKDDNFSKLNSDQKSQVYYLSGYSYRFKAITTWEPEYFELAISNINNCLTQKSDNIKAHQQLTLVYLDYGKTDMALKIAEKQIKNDPTGIMGYYCLGNIYKSVGDYSNAYINYKKFMAYFPDLSANRENTKESNYLLNLKLDVSRLLVILEETLNINNN